jgi:hypothetical protein
MCPPSSRRNPKEHVQERRDGKDVPAGTTGKIRYHTACPCVQHLLSGTLYAVTFENFHRFTGSLCNHGSPVITFKREFLTAAPGKFCNLFATYLQLICVAFAAHYLRTLEIPRGSTTGKKPNHVFLVYRRLIRLCQGISPAYFLASITVIPTIWSPE